MNGEGRIELAILGKTVFVHPSGYATQANSLDLPDFIEAMFAQGCSNVTFDLADCAGMDSTFMGVIAGAALHAIRRGGKTVAVINAKERARKELAFIGLTPVVALVLAPVKLPPGIRLSRIGTLQWPSDERQRILKVKKLHENLVRLNEKNRDRFGPVLDMLEHELQQG